MSSTTATATTETEAGPAPAATHNTVAKYSVELIGAFVLVFTAAAVSFTGTAMGPVAVGAVILALVYAGGHISGGHYNPAISLAALVRGRLDPLDAAGYWIVQLVGGVLGALLARWVVNPTHVATRTLSGHLEPAGFVAELLFTFALCYVVLNVATSRDHPVNSFYGLAIGFTVIAGAFAVGSISGAAFNPAVVLGAAASGLFAWSTLWVYILAQVVGGVLAGLAFRALNPADS